MPYGQWWTRSYQSQGTMLQSGNRRENRIVVGAILVSFAFAMAAESKLVKQQVLISVTMEMRCFHKKLEFQRYPPKDFCTARYEHKSSKKKVSNFSTPPPKKNSWADLGPRSAEKTQPNVDSKRRDSESSTDIDGQNQRLRHEI